MFKSLRRKLIICSIFTCVFGLSNAFGQNSKATSFVNVTPNRFAPEFYGDDLSLKATLVNLPGANVAGSTWTLWYEVYFLPEGQLREVAAKKGGRLGDETGAGDFPKRIYLGKGNFTKKSLTTLDKRTVTSEKLAFKSKVPEALQMEGANIMTVFTIKIYDAKLKKNIVNNGIFYGRAFVGDKQKREKAYLNFYVDSSGGIFRSQVEKEDDSTDWEVK